MSVRPLLLVGCLMEAAYLSLYLTSDIAADVALFIGIQAFCYLLLILALKSAVGSIHGQSIVAGENKPVVSERTLLLVVLAFGLLFRLTMIPHLPVASDDIYRYVWDGRVASAGINPFRYAPGDPALGSLRMEGLPDALNFPLMRTIYPPFAQGFFLFANLLFGSSIAGLKFLFVVADLATMLLLVMLLRRTSTGETNGTIVSLMAYAWSPVPVLYLALDGHVDALGIPFMILFLLFALSGKHVRSAVALGFAGLSKLYPLFLLPFLLHVRARWWVLLIPVVMLLGGYLFYVEETGGIYESFVVYNARFEFNGALFSLMKSFGFPGESARILCGLLFLSWIGFLFFLRRPLPETLLLAFLGILLCSPTAHPWYFTWLAALLAVRWSAAVFLLIGLTNLSNLVVYHYRVTGEWIEQPLLVILEYAPFLVLFAVEIARKSILRDPALESS